MKGLMRMYCPKCQTIWRVNTNRKVCYNCGGDMIPMPRDKAVEEKVDTRKCNSCGYRWMNGAKSMVACQYILHEGHSRPCGGGSKCTVYRKSRVPFELKGEA